MATTPVSVTVARSQEEHSFVRHHRPCSSTDLHLTLAISDVLSAGCYGCWCAPCLFGQNVENMGPVRWSGDQVSYDDKPDVHAQFDPHCQSWMHSLLKIDWCRLHPPSFHAGLLLSPLEFFLCLCAQSTVPGCTCRGFYKSFFADESGGTTASGCEQDLQTCG